MFAYFLCVGTTNLDTLLGVFSKAALGGSLLAPSGSAEARARTSASSCVLWDSACNALSKDA